jgi:methylisocitrate lyase
MPKITPGKKFRDALAQENPLQIVGTINAYSAILARDSGFQALYLSGAGVANASYGLPDIGMTSADNVLEDVRRITDAVDTPLLVDCDTGWGTAFDIARTTKAMIKAGAAAIHIEDQVSIKRCGHRPNKKLVSTDAMIERIQAAVNAKTDDDFVVMARTDALAVEGMDAAIERACRYVEAGADMIFPEAMKTLDQYQQFANAVKVPILANITEFGQTPLYTTKELASADVSMVLYPLSAFRAMSQAALHVYESIRQEGTQKAVLDTMQPRETLYAHLKYHDYEERADVLLKK